MTGRILLNTISIRKIIVGDVNAPRLFSYTVSHKYPIENLKDKDGKEKENPKVIHITKIQLDENAKMITGETRYYVWGKTNNEGEEWIWKAIINQPSVLEFFEPAEYE